MSEEIENKIEEVGELAYEYEQEYGNCPQCVTAAFHDVFGFPSENVVKAGSGLGGGVGLTGNTCGALIGAAMVVSFRKGRSYENLDDDTPTLSFRMAKELCERFEEEYGSVNCYDIQEVIMGDSFNLWNEEEYRAFEEAGGHDNKCPSVAKNAAIWAAKILDRRSLL